MTLGEIIIDDESIKDESEVKETVNTARSKFYKSKY